MVWRPRPHQNFKTFQIALYRHPPIPSPHTHLGSVWAYIHPLVNTRILQGIAKWPSRRGGLHICEQNCALIVQSDLDYWGLDDVHLQVSVVSLFVFSSFNQKPFAPFHCAVAAVLHKQILPTHGIGSAWNRGGGESEFYPRVISRIWRKPKPVFKVNERVEAEQKGMDEKFGSRPIDKWVS